MTPPSVEAPDHRLFLTDDGEPRAFVIVSSARSGSNLLVSYLQHLGLETDLVPTDHGAVVVLRPSKVSMPIDGLSHHLPS